MLENVSYLSKKVDMSTFKPTELQLRIQVNMNLVFFSVFIQIQKKTTLKQTWH